MLGRLAGQQAGLGFGAGRAGTHLPRTSGTRPSGGIMSTIRLVAAGLLLLSAIPALADEAADTFDKLYGDDLKRVAATPSAADDLALAKQLLEAAGKVTNQKAFLALLCEKAHELAIKDPAGYPTAKAARELLAANVAENKVESLQKMAAMYQRPYATARGDAKSKAGEALIDSLKALADAQAEAEDVDGAGATLKQALTVATTIKSESRVAIQAQLAGLAPRQQAEKQIAALKAKLEKNPQDAATRKEIVRLYLLEMDDPAEAAKFVDETLDEATRKYVPAAARPMEEAPELACNELGDWYRGLADQAAAPASKGAMLRRAQGYYARFLDLHPGDDLARTAATLVLKRVADALEKLRPAAATPAATGGWVDCLKLVDLEKNVVQGKWERKGRALVCAPAAGSRTAIPVTPTGSYEVRLTFARMTGTNAVAVLLPVGPTACGLVLSAKDGEASGLEGINGKWAGANESAVRPGTLVNGREYALDIRVVVEGQKADIAADLDGTAFVHWKGPVSALSISDYWKMPNIRFLGLGSWEVAVEFRSVRVRAIPDKAAKPGPRRPKG